MFVLLLYCRSWLTKNEYSRGSRSIWFWRQPFVGDRCLGAALSVSRWFDANAIRSEQEQVGPANLADPMLGLLNKSKAYTQSHQERTSGDSNSSRICGFPRQPPADITCRTSQPEQEDHIKNSER